MREASSRFGKPIEYPENAEALLTRAGFTDITHKTVFIPLQPRSRVNREYKLEGWFKLAMCLEDENGVLSQSFEGLSMCLFTRQLGWTAQEVRSLCNDLRKICNSRDWPIYYKM